MINDIGELEHRVQIQALTSTRNDVGDVVETWATVASRWAKIEPQTGSESNSANKTRSIRRLLITMRCYTGLTTQHRLVFQGRAMNIDSINNILEDGNFHEVECVEEV